MKNTLDDAFRLLVTLGDDLCEATQMPGRLRRIGDPALNSQLDGLGRRK